ncbi:hypothetical protein K431DRAFT_20526 [Polychaeton citri CBS 116435]|uniref:Uncharacterized protein n=1 Tax=Polychaeton citri CBS 116435 TaxID=1314669 RepID=A0A9P4UKV0_9PEZI|nr:hypothetical protein K431DRAFT_20526 [Polychaeton citri CBS 116435]
MKECVTSDCTGVSFFRISPYKKLTSLAAHEQKETKASRWDRLQRVRMRDTGSSEPNEKTVHCLFPTLHILYNKSSKSWVGLYDQRQNPGNNITTICSFAAWNGYILHISWLFLSILLQVLIPSDRLTIVNQQLSSDYRWQS